jgi:hypothetical protein
MPIANLFNIPSAQEDFFVFAYHNAQHHVAVTSALASQGVTGQPFFILDPLPINDPSSWLLAHQTMHNFVNSYLNIPGNDLTAVDFSDREQRADWIQLHATEHRAWGNVLQVG